MKGILDFFNNKWYVGYRDDVDDIVIYKTIPVSSKDVILNKKNFRVELEVEMEIIQEPTHVSLCTCTNENDEMHSCKYFVGHGINDCLKYENSSREVANILKICDNSNNLVNNLTAIEVVEKWGEWSSASGYLTLARFAEYLDRGFIIIKK